MENDPRIGSDPVPLISSVRLADRFRLEFMTQVLYCLKSSNSILIKRKLLCVFMTDFHCGNSIFGRCVISFALFGSVVMLIMSEARGKRNGKN